MVIFPPPYPPMMGVPAPASPNPTANTMPMVGAHSAQAGRVLPAGGKRARLMPGSVIGSDRVLGFPGAARANGTSNPGGVKYAYPRPIAVADVDKAWFLANAALGAAQKAHWISTAGVTLAGGPVLHDWLDQGGNAIHFATAASDPAWTPADAVLNGAPSATWALANLLTSAFAAEAGLTKTVALFVGYLAALPGVGATFRLLNGVGAGMFVDIDHAGDVVVNAGVSATSQPLVLAGKPFVAAVRFSNTGDARLWFNSVRGIPLVNVGANFAAVTGFNLGNAAAGGKGGATLAEVRYFDGNLNDTAIAAAILEAGTRYKIPVIAV